MRCGGRTHRGDALRRFVCAKPNVKPGKKSAKVKSGGKGKGAVARVTTHKVSRRTVLEMASPDRRAQ